LLYFSDYILLVIFLILGLCSSESDVYGQAASNLVAGTSLEATVQQIIDMGGGSWDRDTVVRALRAAFNNPERAVEYLYSVSLFPVFGFIIRIGSPFDWI
jgi:hypothetical protein